jgi:hypothetical protein
MSNRKESCATCKAFNAMTNQCRRKSPVMVPIPVGPARVEAMGLYPATNQNDWCMEYLEDASAMH